MTTHDAQADTLAERMVETTLGTMDAIAISLGDRLGYYRALREAPATSRELADRAGVHERYAREWLEHQAVAGVLEVDDTSAAPEQRRYSLPPGHAEVLTDPDSLRNLTPIVRAITAAALQLPAIERAHRTGGGVSWDAYGDEMRRAQADANRPLFLQWLVEGAFRSLPDVDRRLSGGGRVADVGCGHGWSAIAIALGYPRTQVDGYDVDQPSIEAAQRNAEQAGVADRVLFHAEDPGEAAEDGAFDLVTAFECIHDMPDPVGVLASMRRMRSDGGTVIVMDERVAETFTAPGDESERLFYGYSLAICLNDGMAHPGSVGTGTVMRPETLRRYARGAGFADLEILPIEHDTFRFYRLVG